MNAMKAIKPKKSRQQGLASIELAISLPFLILMLVIMGELGYLMFQQTSLTKSIENGAMYAAKNTRLGTGLVKIEAQTIQDARNLVIYGSLAGTGNKIIESIEPEDISLSCSYGTKNGFCEKEQGIQTITIQANVNYDPVLGSLFHAVTGYALFPLTLSATSIVVPI